MKIEYPLKTIIEIIPDSFPNTDVFGKLSANFRSLLFVFFLLLIRISVSFAQDIPLGKWESHFNYLSAQHVVLAGDHIFCSTYNGLFYINTRSKQIKSLSKSDGLTETGISSMAYSDARKSLLIAYRSGNMDLVSLNDNYEPDQITFWPVFSAVTDLPGNKDINKIIFHEGLAYLATNFGIVVLDIKLLQVQETYRYIGNNGLEVNIRDIAFASDSIFALTNQGILSSSMQSSVNRQYFANWKPVVVPFPPIAISSQNDNIYAGFSGKGIFRKSTTAWLPFLPGVSKYYSFSKSAENIVATLDHHIAILTTTGEPKTFETPLFALPKETLLTGTETIWTADAKNGLISNAEGTFKSYNIPQKDTTINPGMDSVVTDQNALIWTRLPAYLGGGISVKDIQTNQQRILTTASGNGSLPSSNITSLAVDNDGYVWFASDKGIGYFISNDVLSGTRIDAVLPIYGQRKLFANEKCTSLAVEPGNRKWIGTNSGLYEFSPDGTELIQHFTASATPLPSDVITALQFEPENGILFIGTPNGLVSYRSNSTIPSDDFSAVTIFPNPVRSGYSGQVGFKGLMDESTVKITQLSGRLVYETQSQGGTASWNLNDYTGRRATGGIYMVIIVSDKGEKLAGKLAIID